MSDDYAAKIKEVYADTLTPKEPPQDVYKRGFSEAIVDLGDGDEPDVKLLDALEGFQILRAVGGFTVMPKQGAPGFYAHVLFDSPERYAALDRVIAFSDHISTKAVALEQFPEWALTKEGSRAHVFFGVGDSEEKQPVKPPVVEPVVEPEPPKEDPPSPPPTEEPVKPSRIAAMVTRVREFFA